MRPRYFQVCLTLNGFRWTGRGCLEGRTVEVCSAWGYAAPRPLGRRKPERLAEDMLLEILAAKLAALEARRDA